MKRTIETKETPEIYLEEINSDNIDYTGFKIIHQRKDWDDVMEYLMDSVFKTNKKAWVIEYKIGIISNFVGHRILYIVEDDFPPESYDIAIKALDNYINEKIKNAKNRL